MKKNLSDYVKHFKLFLENDLCDKTVDELNKVNDSLWNEHLFYDSVNKRYYKESGDQELSTLNLNIVSTKQIIMKKIWHGIDEYIKNLNFSWFDGWQGYSEIRFNKYSKNTKMAKHCDHIKDMFDGKIKGIPILSVLGVLNDNYEGGEFIMFEDKKIKFKKGDLCIFPSIFLYPHRVEPIKKGIRYSFISWVH